MNFQKPHKTQKDGLFSQNIPMKKSIIFTDNNFLQTILSGNTVVPRQRRKTQNLQNKISSIYAQNITYPGLQFLAQKLKRILESNLLKSFQKIKSYRKTKVNLDLLKGKSKRFIASAFLKLKLYSQTYKGQRIVQTIQRNHRPHLIYLVLNRVVKKNYKIFLQKLRNLMRRGIYMDQFVSKLVKITKNYPKKYFIKTFINNIQNLTYKTTQKEQGVAIIKKIFPKLLLDTKLMVFQKIILSIKVQTLQNINLAKKQTFSKLNQTAADKTKNLVYQREQIRKIKNNIEDFATDTTKARYQIRRDLNVQRNRIKEQEKKFKGIIVDLTKLTINMEEQLKSFKLLNQKRLFRINNPINKQTVKQLYLLIWQEQSNNLGEIKLINQIREKVPSYQQQLDKLNEYHAYKNQRLRQQVFQHQNIQAFKSRWPQEQLIIQQNQTLKQLIKCIIFRFLQNKCFENHIKQISK